MLIRYQRLLPDALTLAAMLVASVLAGPHRAEAQPTRAAARANGHAADALAVEDAVAVEFGQQVQPLIARYCLRCHNEEVRKSGIRVDQLDGTIADQHRPLWAGIRKQLADGLMPPEDEPQPTAEQRQQLTDWIDDWTATVRSQPREKNGSIRRLTVAQYRNTLRELLGIDDDLTDTLPPDAVSHEGFLNNEQTMLLSPLLVEAYFSIAEQMLQRCLVDELSKPVIQNFRVDLGTGINPEPYPERLILGANNHLLRNADLLVTQLAPAKPFAYQPLRMRTGYRFIEGYQGNDTVRGWRDFDSIYHSVFACMRGTEGYPKGLAYETVPAGLLLRPAIPSAELFQVESTYGPRANFKISLRELPDHGRFRVTVTAARYDDGLLLDPGAPLQPDAAIDSNSAASLTVDGSSLNDAAVATLPIDQAGIYQLDVYSTPLDRDEPFAIEFGERTFSGQLWSSDTDEPEQASAFLLVRLPAGVTSIAARYGDPVELRRLVLTRVDDASELAGRFQVFEQRAPRVGVHLGLRRDCGSTLTQVGTPQTVESRALRPYVFEGAIGNYPSPEVEADNVNYLAGIREMGVRSEYTDGRDMPRLLIRSVEFEGPLYDRWPPASHRDIFVDSPHRDDPPRYAREIVRHFATRAFRRPLTPDEETALVSVWQRSYQAGGDFRRSVQDALLVVLTSPQFLFLIETSDSPQAEPLDDFELASKLSYFLWNGPPDERLLERAAADELHSELVAETDRMLQDRRLDQFVQEFAAQWLSLDKLDVVEVDRNRYPRLTRDVRTQLRREPVELLRYLMEHNLPLRHLVQSDLIVANEVVASYYDLGERTESGFEFVPLQHDDDQLGGLLTQAGILAALSDGREANPVKRGAWLARKIIAEPPDDPPPNVPALPPDDGQMLTLREKLERHRNQEGCVKCHEGIDPWGLPLEQFDAGGRFRRDPAVDARSTLPDGTQVRGTNELKEYLADQRLDQVAFSVLQHLASYACGRSLSYTEIEFLREKGLDLKPGGYRLRDMIVLVVESPLFLEK